MADSLDGRSPDAKSIASKTSISVKLPSAASKRDGTPAKSPVAQFEEHDVLGRALTTTPVSSKENQGQQPAFQPPSRLLRQSQKPEKELIKQAAATIIERAWIAYRDRQMFRLLKHAVCAAETSLSKEILRKVCPKEAELLNDKSQNVKVRFRFGGSEFPPMIFFKIFIHTEGKGVKYLSGKRVIKPATEASEDSLRLMGNRKFYDQMLQDAMFQQQYKVTDEVDVTTLKDYMQYLANVDEAPASQGGKENYWRKLTLDVLSRRTIFYDVIDYLYNQRMTPRLRLEIPVLVQRPVSQEIKVQQIRVISHARTETYPLQNALPTPKSKASGYLSQPASSRRSRQAKVRAMKLRKMYGLDREGSKLDSREPTAVSEEPDDYFDKYGITGEEGEEIEEWEREASKLYEWTQELSFQDDLIATPRLPVYT